MVHPPFIKPEEPAPATARPAINMGDEFASAHMREPISNMKRKIRKTAFLRKNVYNLPAIGCREPLYDEISNNNLLPRKIKTTYDTNVYAPAYHPMSTVSCKSAVMIGVAVLMMELSK